MSETFVRSESSPSLPPPVRRRGILRWVQDNLFSSWLNSLLTIAAVYLLVLAVPPLLDWALFDAVFDGTSGAACSGAGKGACWAFVEAKFNQFIYGRYPDAEQWRVNLAVLLGALGLVALLTPELAPRFPLGCCLRSDAPRGCRWSAHFRSCLSNCGVVCR